MRKTAAVLTLSLSTTILALAPVSPVDASKPADRTSATPETSRRKYGAILPDKYYDTLAQCETGSNWNHNTRSYTGGLGIYKPTFRRWSKYHSARGLTPRQQVRVADASVNTCGESAPGDGAASATHPSSKDSSADPTTPKSNAGNEDAKFIHRRWTNLGATWNYPHTKSQNDFGQKWKSLPPTNAGTGKDHYAATATDNSTPTENTGQSTGSPTS
jgi:hypothetical protein